MAVTSSKIMYLCVSKKKPSKQYFSSDFAKLYILFNIVHNII